RARPREAGLREEAPQRQVTGVVPDDAGVVLGIDRPAATDDDLPRALFDGDQRYRIAMLILVGELQPGVLVLHVPRQNRLLLRRLGRQAKALERVYGGLGEGVAGRMADREAHRSAQEPVVFGNRVGDRAVGRYEF